MVQQIVLPIKDTNILKMVQDTLLDSVRAGRRNYTVFQVGKATLLRVSDVMTLTYLGLNQDSRETMLNQIDFG